MEYPGVREFCQVAFVQPRKTPVALIFVEDDTAVDETVTYHLNQGFGEVVVIAHPDFEVSDVVRNSATVVRHNILNENAEIDVVNTCIAASPGTWFYYCYNAEFLFYPFCEHRDIQELIVFHVEERRSAFLTYVVDLYASDLHQSPSAVSLDHACLDKTGYYALGRKDADGDAKARQLDFYGGLRWRFEEHIPKAKRRIDRVSLFCAKEGLKLNADYTFNDEEYNTYACPWHNNITMCAGSFRTAKALKRNPGSTFDIKGFTWRNSIPFEWHSQQLLDLGLMEPGQWF